MKMWAIGVLVLCCMAVLGCGGDKDAASLDSGAVADTGGGWPDTGTVDSGSVDSGVVADTGVTADTGPDIDSGTDAGPSTSAACISACEASLACFSDADVAVCTAYCDTYYAELEAAGCADEIASEVECVSAAEDICVEGTCQTEGTAMEECFRDHCNMAKGGACAIFELLHGCGPGPWKC